MYLIAGFVATLRFNKINMLNPRFLFLLHCMIMLVQLVYVTNRVNNKELLLFPVDLEAEEPEVVFTARQKIATLGSCFSQLTHKALAIFQNSTKMEVCYYSYS